MRTKKWVVESRPQYTATSDNFRLIEEDLPQPGAGEFVVETLYLRTAPPMLLQMVSGGIVGKPIKIGSTMNGGGIGRVVDSNHDGFRVGDLVSGTLPWQDVFISGGGGRVPLQKLAPPVDAPISTTMHVLGAPGLTAYFGMYEYAKPRIGDTLVVSTAAGAVGAVVCQLGKLQGCRVVGITGTDQKSQWLQQEAGVDVAINYKTANVAQALEEACPSGIDIYFDNVGGDTLDTALALIAPRARVVLCGASSQYTKVQEWDGPKNYFNLVYKQAEMYGFYIFNFQNQFAEATRRLNDLVNAGDLKYAEDIMDGIENVPASLERVLSSENLGTMLVRINPE